MKLYHGTTEAVARLAFERGLSPRADTGVKSTWTDHPSRDDMVYLSQGYAPYFAACAAREGERWGIVEVETNLMEEPLLHPDEDFLEQVFRHAANDPCDPNWDMSLRTKFFRDQLEVYQPAWEQSVEGLGNCAYLGQIVPSEVTRVAIYDPNSNPSITVTALDPMISIMNWKFCSGKYVSLTEWFFGVGLQPGHFDPFYFAKLPAGAFEGAEELMKQLDERRKRLEGMISNRSGVEILEREVLR